MLNEIKSLIKERQQLIAMQESEDVLVKEMNTLSNTKKDFLESVLVLNEEVFEEEKDSESTEENEKEPELSEEDSGEDFANKEIDENDIPEISDNEDDSSNDNELASDEEDIADEDITNHIVEDPENKSDDEVSSSDNNDSNDSEPNDFDSDDDTYDLDNQPVDDLANDNELPEPVGKSTGEPVQNADNVILSTEIDISTGTSRDILPIPPSRAIDSIASDDQMTNHLDSGFDDTPVEDDSDSDSEYHNVEADDIIGSPVVDYGANGNENDDKETPEENEDNDLELESMIVSDDMFTEEINIGTPTNTNDNTNNDQNNQQNTQQNNEAPADVNVTPEDTTGTGGTTQDTQPEEDSPVTKEVLDQVNNTSGDNTETDLDNQPVDDLDNMEVPEPPVETDMANEEVPTDTPPVEDSPINDANGDQAEKIFNKLSSITKDVEDAKKEVIQILNKK